MDLDSYSKDISDGNVGSWLCLLSSQARNNSLVICKAAGIIVQSLQHWLLQMLHWQSACAYVTKRAGVKKRLHIEHE